MSPDDLAIWQADIAERRKYELEIATVHWCVNAQSERAKGTFEDDGEQGEGE